MRRRKEAQGLDRVQALHECSAGDLVELDGVVRVVCGLVGGGVWTRRVDPETYAEVSEPEILAAGPLVRVIRFGAERYVKQGDQSEVDPLRR